MLQGFYKVRYQVNDAVGRSVMYARAGKMLGGNSAFAHYGTFEERDGEVISEITSHRHNHDPNYQSLLGADIATIDVRGRAQEMFIALKVAPGRCRVPYSNRS